MRCLKNILLGLSIVFAVTTVADDNAIMAPSSSAPVYEGEAKNILDQMEKLFEASRKVNKPAETRQKFRKVIDDGLDWDKIAEDCLGKNKAKASGSQLGQFRNLLRDVAEKTAFTRLDSFWDGTTYQFNKIEVNGEKAHASSQFKVNNKTFSLDYYLRKKNSHWLIYDIAFKNERYSQNIGEQINEFMAKGNLNTLLEKLKKRRDELDTQTKRASAKPQKDKA